MDMHVFGRMAALTGLGFAFGLGGCASMEEIAGEPEPTVVAGEEQDAEEQQGDEAGYTYGDDSELAVISEGTNLTVRLEDELSTTGSEVGDEFSAEVLESSEGEALAGAMISGEVTGVTTGEETDEPAVIRIDFNEIEVDGETYPLEAEIVEANAETERDVDTGEAALGAGIGAAAGAVIGQILTDDEAGTILGGVAGAAAGTAIVLGNAESRGVLAEGAEMEIRVEETVDLNGDDDLTM